MTFPADVDFYVSADLGQARDYTAIVVLEEPVWAGDADWAWEINADEPGWHSPADMRPAQVAAARQMEYRRKRPSPSPLWVRHIERLPLGTSYPAVVEHLRGLLRSGPLSQHRTVTVLDFTGVGRAVYDIALSGGIQPYGVQLHGGDRHNRTGRIFRVPKRDIIAAGQVALQSDRLKIARSLPYVEQLREELLGFTLTIDPKTAHDSYSSWREGGAHDDLVLALCQAIWLRNWAATRLDPARSHLPAPITPQRPQSRVERAMGVR